MADKINGLLFDLDGVIYVGDRVIDGAVETIHFVKSRGIPYRFVTNTTTKSREDLAQKMQSMGLPVKAHEILSAPYAARVYLRQRQPRSCYFVVSEAVMDEFREFPASESNPEVVVIGDIGRAWNYDLVNQIFQWIMDGADLVALHKGKYWQTLEGLRVDIGAFIAGLEYATGVEATVIGKPSPAFFESAILELDCRAEGIVMVGDDIESDIAGAQRSGLLGFLVRTGKYRQEVVAASFVSPDEIIDSIAQLVEYL